MVFVAKSNTANRGRRKWITSEKMWCAVVEKHLNTGWVARKWRHSEKTFKNLNRKNTNDETAWFGYYTWDKATLRVGKLNYCSVKMYHGGLVWHWECISNR